MICPASELFAQAALVVARELGVTRFILKFCCLVAKLEPCNFSQLELGYFKQITSLYQGKMGKQSIVQEFCHC